MSRPIAVSLAALLLTGCAQEPTWHGDVEPIVTAHCSGCHQGEGIAPFTLTNFDEVVNAGVAVRQAVANRTMPPWGAARGHRDYRYDVSLTDAQVALVEEWFEAGMPLGEPTDASEAIELDRGGMSRADVRLEMPTRYTPNPEAGPDEYRCFAFEWTEDEPAFVTGFTGVPGNENSVHHIGAYVLPPFNADAVDSFDALHEGPGYSCYGDPTPDGWEPELTETLLPSFLGTWSPGRNGVDFPAGTGLQVEPGSRIVIQMHYSTLVPGDLADQSAIEFKVDRSVDKPAYYVPWMDVNWYFGSMLIPAGEEDVRHRYRATLSESSQVGWANAESLLESPVLLHAVFPHMHKLGREIEVSIVRQSGTKEVVTFVPNYRFEWQQEYYLVEPVVIEPEDEILIECAWDNTAQARGRLGMEPVEPVDVNFGEGTVDEMCIAILYLTAQ